MKKLLAVLLIIVLSMYVISTDTIYATETQNNEQEDEKDKDTSSNQLTEEDVNALIENSKEDTSNQKTAQPVELTAKSAVLMEGSTGEILYEKDKDLKMEPASITKIMTLLLIFEALDAGKIALTDEVSVSDHAASMGGSQVYLEPNETQTVDTMIKCISIASANDACVAMAEHIAGSETEFVARMNARAKELGMNNTNFENCCGLDDSTTNHVSTAYDVALMSKELITKYPEISKYSTTWMTTFTHVTKKGESEFGLTNTNKLVRTYKGITGLKTGSTSKAKYCLSATANRNGMNLIAVVMSAPEPVTRFKEAAALMDYGFANCSLFEDDNKDLVLEPVPINNGVEDTVNGKVNKIFSYVCLTGKDPSSITKDVMLKENLNAPVNENDEIGSIIYKLDGKEIGSVPILAEKTIRKATYADSILKTMQKFFLIK